MSDNTIKSMFYFIISLLTIYPVIELIFRKHKAYVRVIIGIFILFFWFIAYKYKVVTDNETTTANKKAQEQTERAENATKELKTKTDSTNYYLNALKDSIKSMNLSEDKRKEFNTYIEKVNTLNQY